jgi:hypothetical protein
MTFVCPCSAGRNESLVTQAKRSWRDDKGDRDQVNKFNGLRTISHARVDSDVLGPLDLGSHLRCSGSVWDNRVYTDLHSLTHPILLAWESEICCSRRGDAQQEGYDAMPMRRTIGISLACLVTSACAIAETPEESTTQSIGVTPGNAEIPIKSRSFACGAEERWAADYGSERSKDGRASFAPAVDACDDASDHCCSPMRATGRRELGRAAWYGMVGNRTASGEILDTRTATAAHRSLPLALLRKSD